MVPSTIVDAGAGVFRDAILIDDRVEGRAIAEAILEHRQRNAGQRERVVDAQFRLVLVQPHLVGDD